MIKEMAGKGRFKVPTSSQMDDKESDVKSMSLFSNFKKKQSATSTDQGNHVKQPTYTRSGGKGIATPQINQDIAVKPSSTNSSLSSLVAPSSSASGATKAPITGHAVKGSTSTVSASCSAAAGVEKSSSSTATSSDARAAGSAVNNETGPAPATKAASTNSIVVNYRQRGNPILKHIRNIPWEYGSIVPDYVLGKANCALFLSLRYHQLNPTYLHNRLKELGKGYDLRVLLVQVDVKDPHHLLKDLAKICILADCTLMLAFTPEEAGRYLEAYKVYENKPAEALMEKTDTDYISKLTDCLTTVKSVNKTDSMTLLSEYKSMEGIVHASVEDLSFCAGFGPQKAKRLYDVFHQPFMKGRKRQSVNSADDGINASPAKKS